LVTLFAPLFYVMIEKLFGKRSKKLQAQAAVIQPTGNQ